MIDRNEAIKRIRAGLKARSGKIWSVAARTAYGWLKINAQAARRTWHFEVGQDGFVMENGRDAAGVPTFKEFDDPNAPGGHMSPADRAELCQLLNVTSVPATGILVSPDAREYYTLAAEGKSIDYLAKFAKTDPAFQDEIRAIAAAHGKNVEDVFAWWCEYRDDCHGADQSAVIFEFVKWYAKQLGEPVVSVAGK